MSFARSTPIAVSAALLVACSSAKDNPGPPPTCPTCISSGPVTGNPATGSGGAGGGNSASGQGGGETATVTGDVVTVDNAAFDSASAYTKPAFITADGLGSKELGQPYDGATFTIDGVAAGTPWFLVTPNTSDVVFPTYSRQNVPADKLTLPVLDREILTSIGLAGGLQLDLFKAQLVLRVTRNGAALKGISAESAGAGLILYDFGPSSYSIQDKVTGGRGIIVLLNQSTNAIKLTDTTQTPNVTYNPEVRATPGTASLIDLDLPL